MNIRNCLLRVLVLFFLPVNAQKFDSMVQEGRTWYCQDLYPCDPHSVDSGYYEHDRAYYVIPRTYVLRGDTVIGENTYKKMYCNERYCCAMRQNGQKVFSVLDGKEEELLDYDFSMVKGMSIMREAIIDERLSIENVDIVYVEGIARKRLMIYDDYKMLADIWVEGIGSMEGPIARWRWGSTTPEHQMVSCMQGDTQLFSHIDFYQTLSVNPVFSRPRASSFYDLQGCRLQDKPSKGVYIQDGKKYLVK